MRRLPLLSALLLALVAPANAETPLALPSGTEEVYRDGPASGRYLLPTGRFTASDQPSVLAEGDVLARVWHLPQGAVDALELIRALRGQLERAGFEIQLDCANAACGGFDFRTGTMVLPPPAMRFDLTAFHVLTATRRSTRSTTPETALSLILSQDSLQAIEVAAKAPTPPELVVPDRRSAAALAAPPPETAEDLATALETRARAVLAGVSFATGSRTLGPEQIEALRPLATLMQERTELAVVIVGHTDNAGALDANIALSRARARAVRQALIDAHQISGARIEAEGVGFLMPLVPNTTEENRRLNRRVEVILR